MSDHRKAFLWRTLSNPFLQGQKKPNLIGKEKNYYQETGYVSRSTDIIDFILGIQSAIILTGAPYLGKSTLVNYLQATSGERSWRDDIAPLQEQFVLDKMHFVGVDLSTLDPQLLDEQQNTFANCCIQALQSVYKSSEQGYPPTVKGLRTFLRTIQNNEPMLQCFFILDNIDRPNLIIGTEQEQQYAALSFLEKSGIIRMLVDLLDEFRNVGVILVIDSLPRPSVNAQLAGLSSKDLARFITLSLKTLTWNDAMHFLALKPEDISPQWAEQFRKLGGEEIFTAHEQYWLLEQAGTHPYLLQQACYYAFQQKQKYAEVHESWLELPDSNTQQLISVIKERLNIFLDHIWKRLEEAIDLSQGETKRAFVRFFLDKDARPNAIIPTSVWSQLPLELSYILSNEGILRDDSEPSQQIRFPGAILFHSLKEKIQETTGPTLSASSQSITDLTTKGYKLLIHNSQQPETFLMLSEIEYHLLQILMQHPHFYTEQQLMEAVWGKPIKKSTFTQRIHQLRNKLKKYSTEQEIIENMYGGRYTLHHPEWFELA